MLNERLLNGVVVGALLVAAGCSNGEADSHPEDTGRVEFALVIVPADVQCIQLTATGTRVRQQSFSVTPGQASVLSMNGLPVGSVTFTGQAFAGGCAGGPTMPSPTYEADPVIAQINATGVTALTLNMRRNGMASISVDFENGGACTPAGSACMGAATTQCCAGLACQGDAAGNLTCQPNACTPAGGGCGGTAACCTGLVCQGDAAGNLTCQPNACTPAGAACAGAAQCCAGLACQGDAAGNLTCQMIACAPAGGACGGTTLCCTGLACQGDAAGNLTCQP